MLFVIEKWKYLIKIIITMKKYLNLFFVALFATMSITLTSCGSDDDEPSTSDLVGTWKSDGGVMEQMGLTQYIRFSSNGRYDEVNLDEGVFDDHLYGDYEVTGTVLSITGGNLYGISSTIVNVTSKTLTIKTAGISQDYVKVADSEMDKYLN